MKNITAFGEIMLRLSPVEKGERLTQAVNFRVEPGGSESNVLIALSTLGLSTTFVTKIPDNHLSEKILMYLQQFNVNTSYIVKNGKKLGTYWTENGIGPRNSNVIYDRDSTSFSESCTDDYNWDMILDNSDWFHFSGISPSISESIYLLLEDVISRLNIPYSVDLNFREKLWTWVGKKPEAINSIMTKLCQTATLIAGNETDFQNVLGFKSKNGSTDLSYREIANKCFRDFENLKYIAISCRESISASSNKWSGILYVRGDAKYEYISQKYSIESIEDRVGTGDSFVAGIIFGIINKADYTLQGIVDFGATLAALNHTIRGDASRFTSHDVITALESKGSGRIIR
jgi:2-dehydro-3-deoxygluconokinase